jgi:uncharacterized membrane protein YkoI
MPSTKIVIITLAITLTGSVVAGRASAEEASDAQEDAREAAMQAEGKLSLEEAVGLAEKQIPGGKVVEAGVDTENGIVSYVVDIEKDGLQTVMIDVRTGEVLSVGTAEEDDRIEDGDD